VKTSGIAAKVRNTGDPHPGQKACDFTPPLSATMSRRAASPDRAAG
jgi:hypothetical protein